MAWIVGIDEAGYGPNLGPFVMTSVACRVPEALVEANLWKVLRTAVRRSPSRPDGRLLIADSKVVYSPDRGLRDLEVGVLSALSSCPDGQAISLFQLLDGLSPSCHGDLRQELWYAGSSVLPLVISLADVTAARDRFADVCRAHQVQWGLVRSVVICPGRFNRFLNEGNSKGAVLSNCLAELVACHRAPDRGNEPVCFHIDKHGGRNQYAAMLQDALPDGLVVCHRESMACSHYSVVGLERDVRFYFKPRADAEHFCVALASMISKYLREVLMHEFNRFWRERVPDLKPTAGYPGDAARFFAQILPAVQQLGIPETAIWRRK